MEKYILYIEEQLGNLVNIPSPSGYTKEIALYLRDVLTKMGYESRIMPKGTVISSMGGIGERIILAAHVDTLGAMVRTIKENGRIRPTTIGGLKWETCDGENCTIHTRTNKVYTGVILNTEPSAHVQLKEVERKEENMEILIDEKVFSSEETRQLGVETGDYISLNPRMVITPSGFIKSRFLDDKLSTAILLGLAKYIGDHTMQLRCKLDLLFTVYEEVGHGGSSGIPEDTKEMISVDMGCVGADLECDETKVSICVKDSGGPYNYEVTSKLIQTAKDKNLNYSVDVYPSYGSDVETTLRSGHELRHGLVGPGVYASHNYERSHVESIRNTLELLIGYVENDVVQ